MAKRKPLRIGMIGYGFMGRAHSNAYRRVNNFFELEYEPVLQAVCARDETKAKKFADTWGYASVETDWRKLIERSDIDAVDICVPNNLHHDMAIAAAKAGKMILCEKPLSMNTAEGQEMAESITIGQTSSRIGRFRRTCRRAGQGCGESMRRLPAAASLAICSRIVLIRRSGLTGRLRA
jgi:hypothetical protein